MSVVASDVAERAVVAGASDRCGIRIVFEFCIGQAELGRFDAITRLLDTFDVSRASVSVMLAPLSITVPWKNMVPGRGEFYARVEAELVKRGRTDIGPLLAGLEQP